MAAEDEDLMGDDAGADAAANGSKGGKGLAIAGLLKWIALGIGAVILIVTVVVVTTLIMNNNKSGNQGPQILSEEYTVSREVLDWYTSLGPIQTKTDEANPATVTVEVVFGYKKDDKATSTEITQRNVELKDYLRRYFTEKTADELTPRNEEKLKIEIRNSINDNILSSSKIKDVRFLKLDVIKL